MDEKYSPPTRAKMGLSKPKIMLACEGACLLPVPSLITRTVAYVNSRLNRTYEIPCKITPARNILSPILVKLGLVAPPLAWSPPALHWIRKVTTSLHTKTLPTILGGTNE